MLRFSERNPRTQMLLLVVRLCVLTLFGLVAWYTMQAIQANRLTPMLETAGEALKHGDAARAGMLFDSALKSQPDNPVTFAAILSICGKNKQPALALQYARRAVQECKSCPVKIRTLFYGQLAQAALDAKQPGYAQEAIDASRRAYELNRTDPNTLNGLGYTLADLNTNLDEAQGYIVQALKLLAKEPAGDEKQLDVSMTEDSYGWVLFRKGRFTEAINALNQAIEDLPEEARAGEEVKIYYFHLGSAYFKAGRIDEARHALQVALRYDAGYDDANSLLKELPAPTPTAQIDSAPAQNPPVPPKK